MLIVILEASSNFIKYNFYLQGHYRTFWKVFKRPWATQNYFKDNKKNVKYLEYFYRPLASFGKFPLWNFQNDSIGLIKKILEMLKIFSEASNNILKVLVEFSGLWH